MTVLHAQRLRKRLSLGVAEQAETIERNMQLLTSAISAGPKAALGKGHSRHGR